MKEVGDDGVFTEKYKELVKISDKHNQKKQRRVLTFLNWGGTLLL